MTTTTHRKSILQALFVTFLWSTSWVLIKTTLNHTLPALTFAGLRYAFACLCLLPLILSNRQHRKAIAALPREIWIQLFLYGVICYTIAQGTLFIALQYIPAAMINLLLNLSPIIVGVAGIPVLREIPTKAQWAGVLACAVGVLIYFHSQSFPASQVTGICAALTCMLANASSTLYGRRINTNIQLPPLAITFISMSFGASLLLTTGLTVQGVGDIDFFQWLVIIWLAVVNTALAWSLWNRSLKVLSAIEISVIGSLMLPQTTLLAFLFLGDTLSLMQIIGLFFVGVGALNVQLKGKISPA